MKDPKTTVTGILSILGAIAGMIFKFTDIPTAITAIVAGIGLILAKDSQK
jgi:hypothetical protein